MERNRLYIIIASVATILGSVLPWGSVNLGAFGGLSISGIEGGGKYVLILAIVTVALAWFKDRTKPLDKTFALGVIALGIIGAGIVIYHMVRIGDISADFGSGFGLSIGFGLYITLVATIATAALGLLVFSGGKFSKDTLTDAASASKQFAQTVGRVTSATVKSAVNEIKKETEPQKEEDPKTEPQKSAPVEAEKVQAQPEVVKETEQVETQVQNEEPEESLEIQIEEVSQEETVEPASAEKPLDTEKE